MIRQLEATFAESGGADILAGHEGTF